MERMDRTHRLPATGLASALWHARCANTETYVNQEQQPEAERPIRTTLTHAEYSSFTLSDQGDFKAPLSLP
jgi:hypothetical protein